MSATDHDDLGGAHARPLGRGLEDVSHLFLSAKPGAEGAPPASVPVAGVAMLRPAQITRERLTALLAADGALEDGLRTLDARIPCHPCGEIDLLGVDRSGRLVIVDVETTASDGLLVRGLAHFDWVVRHLPNVQRMYPQAGADFATPPRLVLLAPQLSPALRRVVRHVTRPQIQWGRYHALAAGAGPELVIEPVAGD